MNFDHILQSTKITNAFKVVNETYKILDFLTVEVNALRERQTVKIQISRNPFLDAFEKGNFNCIREEEILVDETYQHYIRIENTTCVGRENIYHQQGFFFTTTAEFERYLKDLFETVESFTEINCSLFL